MYIQKTSLFSGLTHVVDLPVTKEQIEQWQNGVLIQDAMPHLTSEQREFLVTGMTVQEQEVFYAHEEE